MKNIITFFLLLATLQVTAQSLPEVKLPQGQWVFIIGKDGSSLATEKAVMGQGYLKTVFYFINESKYEFSLEEYDSSGSKFRQVNETGTYLMTSTQFTLQPKTSVTKLLDQSSSLAKTKPLKTTENSLSPAVYNWQLEAPKNSSLNTLNITAVISGFREGVVPTHARSASIVRRSLRSAARAL